MAFNLVNESIYYDSFKAIDSLTLNIQKGEKVALLGKSGSGKSTLLKRMFELQRDSSSYIPQELGLVNNLSVFHNVYISKLDTNSFFYNIRNFIYPSKTQVSGISNILKDLLLEDKLFTKSLNLSGGQRQRVAIARAMYGQNEILLADEPVSALDEFLSKRVIEKLNSSFETVVCTMHNVDLAIENFDRVIGLKDGEVLVDKASSALTSEDRNRLYYATK
ncbi:ATP-binding cassette domain-containing protein [Halarcobacter bivalviorum]|uniref:ATP-binding cassette domain-containing protein n=1 Tax=Halarcobacter bivalviorum TaxID=663364 RepID=UPI00100B2D71|nr:ATP-binding cassette domain-containing protein [Halarcobacter bivalviorum]RXK06007.1 ABC transporter [Halarcobacter bivalviorum]